MVNSKSTKRALLTSALAILACVAMLIGTTFAWFTDTASTAVNKIVSGKLSVDIVSTVKNEDGIYPSLKGESMNFVNKDGSKDILWEPGATFRTIGFKIKNNGSLALKYKLALTGIKGDSELLKVITFSVVTGETDEKETVDLSTFVGHLVSEEESAVLYIQGHMAEDAGNDYQERELEGFGITVVATQDTVENDSYGDQYDANAAYPEIVAGATALKDAIAAGKNTVILAEDAVVEDGVQIGITKDTAIDFNGKTLFGALSSGSISYMDAPNNLVLSDPNNDGGYSIDSEIVRHEGGGMTQLAAISAWKPTVTIKSGRYTHNSAVVLCQLQTSDPNAVGVVIDGGTFDGKGAASVVGNVIGNVVINGGTFNAHYEGDKSGECVYLDSGSQNIPTITTINGGAFNADKRIFYVEVNAGYTQKIVVNGGTFNVADGGSLIEVSSGNASDYLTITGGTFNVNPSAYVDSAKYTVTNNGSTWTVAAK